MKITILGLLLIFTLTVNAQNSIVEPTSIFNFLPEVKNANNDINNLMLYDVEMLSFFPLFKDYECNFKEKVKNSKSTLIFVDSLDYQVMEDDTIFVKIYTENYAYSSKNEYKLFKQDKIHGDTLFLTHVNFDMKMKSYVHDYHTFKKEPLRIEISGGENGISKQTQRIRITKNRIDKK